MEEKVYTIDDIAKELGVSKTTVSRAISGKGRISRATTQRVREFIEAHDYRPNVMARGLAQSKTYNIGMILPVEYGATEFAFFKDCLTGICEEASQYNYDILICMVSGRDLSQIQRLISHKKVDGIILTRALVSSSVQKYLKEKGIPLVVIGPSAEPGEISVDNKNREASRELTSVMLMKGIRRIVLLGGNRLHRVTESRYQGFADACRAAGIELQDAQVILDVNTYTETARAVDQALQLGADGIICMDDFICGQALGYLREKGIRIPSRMKIASLYDSSQLEHMVPSVTGVRFDTRELGSSACKKLLKLLGETVDDGGGAPSYQVILRESTQG